VLREVTHADVAPLSGTLARAFHDDPPWVWSQPDPRRRERRARRVFGGRLRTLVEEELAWTTDDRAGVALWAPPDRWKVPPREMLRATPAFAGLRMPQLVVGFARVDRRHPRRPHLYLAVLGVEPDRQGQGLGSRLLAPGLERCDREHVGAYLETAKERNVAFYERHGFRVTEEVPLPGGPPVWLMWRDPR